MIITVVGVCCAAHERDHQTNVYSAVIDFDFIALLKHGTNSLLFKPKSKVKKNKATHCTLHMNKKLIHPFPEPLLEVKMKREDRA